MRLTNDIKMAIRSALIERKLSNRKKALAAAGNELAVIALTRLLTATDWALLATLPAGWLPVTDRVRLYIEGEEGDSVVELRFENPQPIPECMRYQDVRLDPDDDLAIAARKHEKTANKLFDEERELRSKISDALAAYQTKKQLLAGWPEISMIAARFLHEPARSTGNNLVPVLAELNAELELP